MFRNSCNNMWARKTLFVPHEYLNSVQYRLQLYLIQSQSYVSQRNDDFQYLEHSKVPTMHFQKSLPRLPIPELGKTCEKYLKALKPITPSDQLKKTENIVKKFESGEGKILHEKLQVKDKKNKHTSYICGPWFDMYLKSRTPLVLNYNPFLAFKEDPQKEYNDQLLRATNILVSSLRFLKSFRASILEPEIFHLNPAKSDTKFFRTFTRFLPEKLSWYGAYLFKAFPLDMSQFGNLFNSTRIPKIGKDVIQAFPEARHVLVLRNGYFYVFDVLDSNGNILPPTHLFSLLSSILSDKRQPPSHPIAILTTEERDTWAEARSHLEHLGNADALRLIDSAIFALVLDDQFLGNDLLNSAHHMLHGPAMNRWFDKSFQLIVTKDGKAAINFEHAWGDGVAVLRFFNEVFKDSTTNHSVGPDTMSANIDTSQLIQRLGFNLDETVKSAVRTAHDKYNQTISSLQLNVSQYSKMNRDTIKNFKLSPDSVVQLAFQMAFYKVYSRFVATYESCSTSAFKHGRTEAVRPCTSVTKACVEAFHRRLDSPETPQELRMRLHECTRIHNELTKDAAMGQAFDRHLFGLRCIAEKEGGTLPELYQDPSFIEANHFTLSTSTLFGPAFSGGAFGPVVRDGFGVAYGFLDNKIGCLVSSYSPYRDGLAFVNAVEESLDQILKVLEKQPQNKICVKLVNRTKKNNQSCKLIKSCTSENIELKYTVYAFV